MTGDEDLLDRAIGEWLERREDDPGLLPGAFAARLPETLRARFLTELEGLAAIDQIATGIAPRDLPLRFGGFRVLGELGQGAMGFVYAAEQVATGRRVALKVLHPHIATDARAVSRFRREVATVQALDHPGIAPVLDNGDEGGTAWLAMELVDGHSLQRLLFAWGDSRDVDHPRARALFDDHRRLAATLADAADALDYAHGQGVVHRDVKPANLMIGDDGRVTVLDFGMATARGQEASLTHTGDLLGTPLYMAPEHARGAENVSAKADVYALGAVLYECLCGRPPIPPGPLADVIDAILNREPADPRSVRRTVPEALARIALHCLDKDPGRRYRSAAALADDLRRFVAARSVHARPIGRLRRSLRAARRRPVATALVAAVALLAAVAATVFVQSEHTAATARLLGRDRDLDRVTDLLGRSPERLTVLGGASLRFYRSLGLGERVAAAPHAARSPRAAQALAIAERLAGEFPRDAAVQRSLAMALLDVGDDPRHAGDAIERLLALPDATPGDRAMAAVFDQLQGREAVGAARIRDLPASAPDVAFWLGLWHQHRQDYAAAIDAFDRALASAADLDQERRYFALLHRGWCKTCPDVLQLREAEADLLQAAALRPAYGTARLLWAALRCLDPDDDLTGPVAAVTEVLGGAESWVTVLTARVLLALAEAGTWQSGPVGFDAEFSPIAAVPLAPARAAALAGLALQLLDGVLGAEPGTWEAGYHRITALALVGRHTDAIAACATLLDGTAIGRDSAILLQRARVRLAAGDAQRARADAEAALQLDERSLGAWRLLAAIAAHVGDRAGELRALERALACAPVLEPSVFPDAAVAVPHLHLLRVRALVALGRSAEAEAALRVLEPRPGEATPPRVRWERAALHALVRGRQPVAADFGPGPSPSSPLRWLCGEGSGDLRGLAAALRRGWVMPSASLPAADPATRNLRALHGSVAAVDAALQDDLRTVSPQVLLRHVPRLVAEQDGLTRLLAAADERLAANPDDAEARLLRGAALLVAGQTAATKELLGAALDANGDDLRARYVLAAAAFAERDRALLRRALHRGGQALDASAIEAARVAVGSMGPATAELLEALE